MGATRQSKQTAIAVALALVIAAAAAPAAAAASPLLRQAGDADAAAAATATPIPASADAHEALRLESLPPTQRCLELVAISRQRVSQRMHRLMVTLRKVAEPETDEERGRSASEAGMAPVGVAADGWTRGSSVAPWDEWWRQEDALG